MAKHVIEEEQMKGEGFNSISNGEVEITASNADRKLSLKTDGTKQQSMHHISCTCIYHV